MSRVRPRFWLALVLVGTTGSLVFGYRWVDETPLRQAHAAARRDDWHEALHQVESFLRDHPRNRQALLLWARCRSHLGPLEEAERIFAQIPDPPPEAARLRADNLAHLHWWSQAAQVYERLLALQPNDPSLLRQLAVIDFQIGKYPEALRLSERLAGFPEAAAAAHCMLGAIRNHLNDARGAVADLQQALALNPTAEGLPISVGRIFELLGRNLFVLGRTAEARAAFERAVETNPEVLSYFMLGKISLQLREPERALEWWFRALELEPHHSPTLEALGESALVEGRPEEAIGWLKLAERSNLPSTSRSYLLNRAYTLAGRPDLGRPYLEETRRQQSIDERNALVNQTLVLAPTSPRARVIRAWRAAQEGNWKQAETWIDELLQQYGEHPVLRRLRRDIEARQTPTDPFAETPAASRAPTNSGNTP